MSSLMLGLDIVRCGGGHIGRRDTTSNGRESVCLRARSGRDRSAFSKNGAL